MRYERYVRCGLCGHKTGTFYTNWLMYLTKIIHICHIVHVTYFMFRVSYYNLVLNMMICANDLRKLSVNLVIYFIQVFQFGAFWINIQIYFIWIIIIEWCVMQTHKFTSHHVLLNLDFILYHTPPTQYTQIIIIISGFNENFVTNLFIQNECPAYCMNSPENVLQICVKLKSENSGKCLNPNGFPFAFGVLCLCHNATAEVIETLRVDKLSKYLWI